MKKKILIIALIFACFILFANEMPKYKAVYDSCVFKRKISNPKENGEFKKGDILILENNWAFLFNNNIYAKLERNSVNGDILFDSIVPINTNVLFDDKDISYLRDGSFIYIPLYYCEILKKCDRTLLPLEYEKHIQKISEYNDYTLDCWYEPFLLWNYLKISNVIIGIGYGNESSPNAIYDLNVLNIKKIANGYEVIVSNGLGANEVLTDGFLERMGGWLATGLPKYTDFTSYKIIIKFDGDYVSVFVDNENNLVQTFVKIDADTKKTIEELVKTNTCDLSRVTWPRHADGSCDYDGSLTNVAISKQMSVSENLKLRAGEAISSNVLTVMSAGTKVKVLELGKEETIDGIKSNWVKVEVISGRDRDGKDIKKKTTGWCYGGYLE